MDDLFEFAVKGMRAQAEVNRLCQSNNPQTSYDAAEKIVESGALNRQENEVYQAIQGWHSGGFTTKDIAIKMTEYTIGKAYDICRKRFSGLERKGKIETVPYEKNPHIYKRRNGCRIWRLV